MKEQVVKLVVDHREGPSGLIDELDAYDYSTAEMHVSTDVTTAQLPIGDIVCSDRCCIERKSSKDYIDSFVNDKRDLFGQAIDMMNAYPRSLMILEGLTVFDLRNIHPEALRGSLAGLAVGVHVPIIPTLNVAETAALVVTIARREQYVSKRSVSIAHAKRSSMSLPQRQEYIVSSIGSGVGGVMAAALLKHFKTVERVMSASIDDLCAVPGVGKTTAVKIREIVGDNFNNDECD